MAEISQVLVTGGTGFVGRILVRHLVNAGYLVRVLTRSYFHSDHPKISSFQGDITRLEDLKHAVEGCSAIFQIRKYLKNEEKKKSHFCFSCSDNSWMELFRASLSAGLLHQLFAQRAVDVRQALHRVVDLQQLLLLFERKWQ